jgi:sporulation protein YlmC with PRC-barrel domain
MKTHRTSILVSSVAAAVMLAASPVMAADQAQKNGQDKPADKRSEKAAAQTWEQQHRASKIIGTDVLNAKGEKVGRVKDLVIDDPTSGQVTRLVVSVGGVSGVGDKLFAVPYNQLQRDAGKNALVLNASSDLANAFDDNNWQSMSGQAQSNTAASTGNTSASPATSGSSGTAAASTADPSSTGGSSSGGSSSPTADAPK